MKFSTQSKIAFISATTNIILLAATLLAFTLFTGYLLEQKLKTDLFAEAEEVISQHVKLDGERLVYVSSTSNTTLEQDLATDRLSAQLFTKDGTPMGTFGIFSQDSITKTQLSSVRENALLSCSNGTQQYAKKIALAPSTYGLLYYPVLQQGNCHGSVVIAADMHQIVEIQHLILQLSLVLLIIALFSNLFMGRLAAKLILSPIVSLVGTMQQLSIDRKPGAVPSPNTTPDDPIFRLVNTFNTMALQVHEGVQKQRGFIMNASHELKTPLARAISNLDLAKLELEDLSAPTLKTLLDASQRELLDINATVEILLQAARLRQTPLTRIKLSLDQAISVELKALKNDISAKKLAVIYAKTDSTLYFNEAVFSLLMRNCLTNAIKHNHQDGSISISSETVGNTLTLSISNTIDTHSAPHKPDSHKLGAVIIDTLCELGQCSYNVSVLKDVYIVKLEQLPLG